MTTFAQLLDSVTEASLYEAEKTEFEDINNDLEFWKSEANGESASRMEVRNQRFKETFSHIISHYLTNDPDEENPEIQYSKYAKYLKEDDRSNYLFATIAEKINIKDVSVPVLMVQIISFFDRISKLPTEEQEFFLEQFPMQDEDLYHCGPGIGRRLDTVMMQTENKDIQMINGMIEQETGRLSKFVTNDLIEIHTPAMLYNALCGVSRDTNCLMPISYIPAKNIWDFSRNLVKEYNKNISENANAAQNLKSKYEKYVKGKTKDEIKNLEFDLFATGEDDFADFVKVFFNPFLAKECKLFGNPKGLQDKFFDENDRLILDKNGTPLLEIKINELCNSYSIIEEQEGSTDFNLDDEDAPQKIAKIITSKDSTAYQKHLAIQAIWIMSENFKGNSKVNFIKTLNEIGKRVIDTNDVRFRLTKAKDFIKNLSDVSDSTKGLIFRMISQINGMEKIDNLVSKLPYEAIINDKIKSSAREFVKLGCPAELLDSCTFTDEDLVRELLEIRTIDLVEMIFFNPKSKKLLTKLIEHNDQNSIEKRKDIIFNLLIKDLEMGDLQLTKQIISESEPVFSRAEIRDEILNLDYDLLLRFDLEAIKLIIDSFKKENDLITHKDAKFIMFGQQLSIVILKNDKLDVVKYLFNFISDNDFDRLVRDPEFIFNIYLSNSRKIADFVIKKLEENLEKEQIVELILNSTDNHKSNIIHAICAKSSVETLKSMLRRIEEVKGSDFVKKLILYKNEDDESPLMSAVVHKNNAMVNFLFEKLTKEEAMEQIKIRFKNSESESESESKSLTILNYAIYHKNIEMVKLIFAKLGVEVLEENLSQNHNQNDIENDNQSIVTEEDLIEALGIDYKDDSIIDLLIKNENEELRKFINPIFSKLSDENLIKVLNSRDSDEDTMFYDLALTENLSALKIIFDRLNYEQILEIMRADNKNNISTIAAICDLDEEREGALKFIYSSLIESLKKDQTNFSANLLKLFNSRLNGGNPPLYVILLNAHISAATKKEIIESVIENLDEKDLLTLLTDKNFNQFTFFYPIITLFDRISVTSSNELVELIFNKLNQANFSKLLDTKDESGNHLIQIALSHNNFTMVDLIIDKLSSYKQTNIVQYFTIKNSSGKTLLHSLANRNDSEHKKLLNKIIDILGDDVQKLLVCKDKDNSSNTPLHNAAFHGNLEAIQKMIEKISKDKDVEKIINQTNKNRKTALDIAFEKDSLSIAAYLLKKGSKFNELAILSKFVDVSDPDKQFVLAKSSVNSIMLLLELRYDETKKMIKSNHLPDSIRDDLQEMIEYFDARKKSQNVEENSTKLSFHKTRFASAYNKCQESLRKIEEIDKGRPNNKIHPNGLAATKLDKREQGNKNQK